VPNEQMSSKLQNVESNRPGIETYTTSPCRETQVHEPIREIPSRNHLRMDTFRQREQLVADIEESLVRLIAS
jgi:hypothetical protein